MATLKGIWVFNDTVSVPTGGLSWSVNFVSNGTNYSTIRHDEDSDVMGTNAVYYDTTEVYSIVFSDWWANEAYKTVDFGTTEQTVDDTFYAWLTANATQQASEEEEPTTRGVTVEYNGSVVATIENGNKATLPIKDLKMKSDIVVTVPEATDSPLPIEVSTEAEMTSLLTNGTVGGVYKYTGTTGTYENGALYVLEEEAVGYNVKILGHGDAGFGYYSLNGGEDIQITSANYVAKYTTMTKELADSKCITLTDVKSLICKMNSGDVTYVTVKDSNFNDVESVLYGDWDDPNYNQVLDVTQYLSEGCYVILWTDD